MKPQQIEAWLGENLHRFDGPAQYLGDEPNAPRKSWDENQVRWLIAASWPYFHGAGNQSIPAVCQVINDHPDSLADRFYLPQTPRDFRLLEKAGIPVFGVESKHPAADFDVVGTSISYSVLFMNFCRYLTASKIPLRWADRQKDPGKWPMVMIGGQSYCAPGSFEPVADCVFLGEAEDEEGNGGLGRVCDRIAMFKSQGTWQSDRVACYARLAREFNYLYFPRFVEVLYSSLPVEGLEHPSKQVTGYASLLPGMVMPFKARHVIDMDAIEPLRSAPLLFGNPSMGAGDLEVARGCTCWCSFCRLTWVTKPYRQRTVDMSVMQAKRWMLAMGSNELSPFSPDFPVYTRKNALLAALLGQVSDEIDTTAMRVDDFIDDKDYVLLQAFGGADAVTLGLEGNSQRMRDLVGKGISDDDVLEAFVVGLRAGFRKFKFFMITNLPGEEPGDVMRIVRLGRKLAAARDQFGQPNVLIQFSWTPLLIEAQTPFQWFAPTPPDHTLIDVGDALRDLKIQFKIGTKAEPNKVAFFQLAQRASRDVGEAIVDAIEKLNTACWGGVPRTMRDELESAIIRRGFLNGFGDCFGERTRYDMFGWEFISTGVSPDLLWEAYRQMVEFLEGTDADTYDSEVGPAHRGQEWIGRCDTTCLGRNCGACQQADFRKRREYVRDAAQEALVDLSQVTKVDLSSQAQRVRVRMEIPGRYRFSGPKFWHHLIRRAAYRAVSLEHLELPPGTNIAKRSVRLASDQVKVTDWCRGTDYADFALTRHLTGQQGLWLLEAMGRELAPWCEFGNVFTPYQSGATIPESCTGFYEISSSLGLDVLQERLAAWKRAETVPLRLDADESYFGLATEEVDAKQLVQDIWVIPGEKGQLKVRMMITGKAGPYQAYAAFTGTPSWLALAGEECRRLEWFDAVSGSITEDECAGCGQDVPVSVIRHPWGGDPGLCPRCQDQEEGLPLASLWDDVAWLVR